jgi:hypothetical protein
MRNSLCDRAQDRLPEFEFLQPAHDLAIHRTAVAVSGPLEPPA